MNLSINFNLKPVRFGLVFGAVGITIAPAQAQQMTVRIQIPQKQVAEYHRPYTAIWIEDANGKAVRTLDVWYDTDSKGEDGRKWLSELRGWWRKAGRSATMPADGISGPTQAPGTYRLNFANGKGPLSNLPKGNYKLRVEAAREVGGRELVTIAFSWGTTAAKTYSAKGESELGTVTLGIKP